jgi:hypothetical protein
MQSDQIDSVGQPQLPIDYMPFGTLSRGIDGQARSRNDFKVARNARDESRSLLLHVPL